MQTTSTNQAVFTLGGACLAALSFHWGVLHGIDGVGLALFFVIAFAVLETAITVFRLRTNTWARAFLIPLVFCVLNAALYSHDVTRIVSILVGWASFTLYAYWSTTARVAWQQVTHLAPMSYLMETALPVESAKTPFTLWKEHSSLALRIGLGIAFALPILLFLGLLFADADPVFRQVIDAIFPNVTHVDEFAGRLILDTVFVVAFARGLWLLLTRQSEERTAHDATPSGAGPALLHGDIATTILAAMSVFVGLFVAVQIRVMIGGEAWMRSMDLTYAEYARSGYGQMVVACGLIGAVLLGLYFFRSLQSRASHWLSYVLAAESVLILLSAWGRLQRYVDAYSLTTDRLWGQIFIVALAFGAAWLVWSLARRYEFGRFSTVLVIGAMTYFVAVPCFLNIEGWVVRANVCKPDSNVSLDLPYLSTLSSDGIHSLYRAEAEAWGLKDSAGAARRLIAERYAVLNKQQNPLSFTFAELRFLRGLERDQGYSLPPGSP